MKTSRFIAVLGAAGLLMYSGCSKQDLSYEAGLAANGELKGKPVSYPISSEPSQMQVYGVWHAGNDYCTWGTVRDQTEFEAQNGWLVDRGDGDPSVNLVILSFVNPLDLMNADPNNVLSGIPPGMTPAVVDYFKNAGIRVMLSIGGWTYIDDWNTALATDPTQLGLNAAAVAAQLGAGIEIDYEENTDPNLSGLQYFIDAYRSVHPYDETGDNHAARLTIDLAAGDRWLIALCRHASQYWLTLENDVLDYANAMVPARQPSADKAKESWYEHITGKPQYAPPIPPIAPCKFTGALYITDRKQIPECIDFSKSLQKELEEFVTGIEPYNGTGETAGMLGYMFWAAECPSTRSVCATDCTGGVGEGAIQFSIPIPMPQLRDK